MKSWRLPHLLSTSYTCVASVRSTHGHRGCRTHEVGGRPRYMGRDGETEAKMHKRPPGDMTNAARCAHACCSKTCPGMPRRLPHARDCMRCTYGDDGVAQLLFCRLPPTWRHGGYAS